MVCIGVYFSGLAHLLMTMPLKYRHKLLVIEDVAKVLGHWFVDEKLQDADDVAEVVFKLSLEDIICDAETVNSQLERLQKKCQPVLAPTPSRKLRTLKAVYKSVELAYDSEDLDGKYEDDSSPDDKVTQRLQGKQTGLTEAPQHTLPTVAEELDDTVMEGLAERSSKASEELEVNYGLMMEDQEMTDAHSEVSELSDIDDDMLDQLENEINLPPSDTPGPSTACASSTSRPSSACSSSSLAT